MRRCFFAAQEGRVVHISFYIRNSSETIHFEPEISRVDVSDRADCSGQSTSFLLQYSVQGMTLPPESQIQHVSAHFSPDTVGPPSSPGCQKYLQVLLEDTMIICVTH